MKTKIISLLLLVLLSLTAISCSQEVIFYDIAREVKLVNPEIVGNVYSMVPLNGKLYTQNGYIWEKSSINSAHGWSKFDKPAASGNIIRLASDGDTLYAMDTNFDVWARHWNNSSWDSWAKVASSVTALFDTQNMGNETYLTTGGRTAYINTGSEVKKLNGTGAPTAASAGSSVVFDGDVSDLKAAAFNGTTTLLSSSDALCAVGTTFYKITHRGTTVQYSTDGTTWNNGGSVRNPALCICPYGSNKLLVGTEKGYDVCDIYSTGYPGSGTRDYTNADSAFGRTRQVIMIRYFAGGIYTGVVSDTSSQFSKLWSLFGGVSWNYE